MKPAHILLVEDNEGDILLAAEAVSEISIANTISVVKDGWQAIQFLEKKENYSAESSPDIILLDINLPKMNGLEVVRHIKTSPHLRHIPVIIFTTSASARDISQSYENYANCFITKPVEVGDFLRTIASIVTFWVSIVQLPNRINR
jgi:CheY-like chemotaxis protein